MRPIRRILVRVQNPSAPSLPAVTKAAQLARALGADVTLVQTLANPFNPDDDLPTRHQQRGALQNYTRSAHEACLKGVSAGLRRRGIRVTLCVKWDHTADDALLGEVETQRADLIVIDAVPRSPGDPSLSDADRELLRRSPIPVLLVKRVAPYRRPRILLALDPTCTSPKARAQDAAVVSVGSAISGGLHGSLHAITSYTSLPPVENGEAPLSGAVLAAPTRHGTGGRQPDRVGFNPIAHVATDIRSALVVMGAPLAATPGGGSFTAAARLIQRLACDILIVKPALVSPRESVPSRPGRGYPQPATLISA